MSVTRLLRTGLLAILLIALLPPALAQRPRTAVAQSVPSSSPYYRYQGEPSSYDRYANQQVNCGPASVAMAIQYAQNVSVPIRQIRSFIGKNSSYTSHADLTRALSKWGVSYSSNIVNARSLKDVVARGNIAIVVLDMNKISRGRDVNGASTDPNARTGRFETYAGDHWLVVKGVSPDGKYFQVYDGNVWGGPGNSTYWYSDGTPKGKDRLYRVDEVERGMFKFGPRFSKGVEIAANGRPQVSSGQRVKAMITHYSLTPDQTGKDEDDPAYGIMFNGNRVHWGAVAVDPRYIPLGTRMTIEGYGDQVFTAEDTGSAVKGWHVDVYWDGTKQAALRQNSLKGGPNKTVTLLGPGPAFTDRAPSTPPIAPRLDVQRKGTSPTRWVTLHLSARDPEEDVVGMMISGSPSFGDAFEEPYSPTREWTLSPGDGVKTVYARFKNGMGAWSDAAKAEVTLEEEPPFGYLTVAPDPRVIVAAPLGGAPLPVVGSAPRRKGRVRYLPLGANVLSNASFERWAGGIPDGWDSALREKSSEYYEPDTDAFHGEMGLLSASTKQDEELTQTVILQPGTRYTLSARARGRGGVLAVEELQTQGVTSRSLGREETTSEGGVDGWETVRLSFVTRAETTDARVSLRGYDVLWDAVQLAPGRGAATFRADGVLVEGPARNRIANPSAEGDEGGWDGLNSYVEVLGSEEYARFGRKALAIEKREEGFAATFHPASLKPGASYTFSAYVRLRDGAEITNEMLRGWFYQGASSAEDVDPDRLSDANRPPMRWEAVGGGWYRGSWAFQASAKRGLYGLVSTEGLEVGDVYYLDGVQLEEGAFPTSYLDSTLGGGYGLDRSAPRPFATRAPFALSYGATEGQRGSVLFWARPSENTAWGSTLLELGTYALRVRGERLSLEVGGKRVASASWERGVSRAYAVVWDGEEAFLYQNGKLVGSAKAQPPAEKSRIALGPSDEDGAWANAVIGDLSLWRAPLLAPEVRFIARNAPFDVGLETVSHRRTRVAVAASDSSEGEITVEWSRDGEEWHRWGSEQGLREWDLGPEAGQKIVWVRYTDGVGNWLVYADEVVLKPTAPVAAAVSSPARAPVAPRAAAKKKAKDPTEAAARARVGLGAARVRWERAHGAAEGNAEGLTVYGDGAYSVAYADSKVARLVRDHDAGDAIPLAAARSEADSLTPADARLVKRTVTPGAWVVEVYRSTQLRRRFDSYPRQATLWVGARPGTFTVVYRVAGGRVTKISVAIGAGA